MCDSVMGMIIAIIQHTRIYGICCYKSPKKSANAKPWKNIEVVHKVGEREMKGNGSGTRPRIRADIKGIMSSG